MYKIKIQLMFYTFDIHEENRWRIEARKFRSLFLLPKSLMYILYKPYICETYLNVIGFFHFMHFSWFSYYWIILVKDGLVLFKYTLIGLALILFSSYFLFGMLYSDLQLLNEILLLINTLTGEIDWWSNTHISKF